MSELYTRDELALAIRLQKDKSFYDLDTEMLAKTISKHVKKALAERETQVRAEEREKVKGLVEAMCQARKLIGFVWRDGQPNTDKSNEAYHLLYEALTKAGYTKHSQTDNADHENT
jgi:hypothetical protein